jgi:Ca2+-binding EF-hand superfamily protein
VNSTIFQRGVVSLIAGFISGTADFSDKYYIDSFHKIDINKDGEISYEELKETYKQSIMGMKLTDQDWKEYINTIDINRRGTVNY